MADIDDGEWWRTATHHSECLDPLTWPVVEEGPAGPKEAWCRCGHPLRRHTVVSPRVWEKWPCMDCSCYDWGPVPLPGIGGGEW